MNNQPKPPKPKKHFENKLTHICSHCQATFTLKETHLKLSQQRICATNCLTKWEALLNKHYQEKVLANELVKEEESNLQEQLIKLARNNEQ